MYRSTLLTIVLFGTPVFANDHDWRYVPFFDHPEVQMCAKARALEWAKESKYSAPEIMSEAESLNGFLPELTKTSDRDMSHIQIGTMARMWHKSKQNLRPGISLNLHEYATGLVVTCTFEVYDQHYRS